MNNKKYFPELDGLRGISVICIVLYHTNLPLFTRSLSGAFVALDIFFVISGFLITKSILKDRVSFSYKKFYLRRVKRLYPALITTLFTTLLAGSFIYTPSKLINLAKTTLYSVVPLSNLYFAYTTDYFSYDGHIEPLIHTWSLSMEEQFYLVFPALFLFFYKKLTRVQLLVGYLVLSVTSIIWAQYELNNNSTSAYYLLQFRVSELLLGSSLCLINLKTQKFKSILSLSGFFLILYSLTTLSVADKFPGFNSLYPTIGTALIIQFSSGTILSKYLLNIKLLRIIGQMSYSIYLFHWPAFLLLQSFLLRNLTLIEYSALIILVLIASHLSRIHIELRYLKIPFGSKQEKKFIRGVGISLFILVVAVIIILNRSGFSDNKPIYLSKTKEQRLVERRAYWNEIYSQPSKDFSKSKLTEKILFIGDSHTVDLINMFATNGFELTHNYLPTPWKCSQFTEPKELKYTRECLENKIKVLNYIKSSKAQRIYLHNAWYELDEAKLKDFIASIRKHTDAELYIFGPKMAYSKPVDDIAHMAYKANLAHSLVNELARFFEYKERFKIGDRLAKLINEMPDSRGVKYIDIMSLHCGAKLDECNILSKDEQELLYFDDTHFNLTGAKQLGEKIKEEYPYLFVD